MRITLYIILLAFISCAQKEEQQELQIAAAPSRKSIPAFTTQWQQQKIKEIPIVSKNDTINYALGIAWGSNISKVGLDRISGAFYLGVFDQFVQNTSFIHVQEANERLDKELLNMRGDRYPKLNPELQLKDITMQSVFDTLSYELGYIWAAGAKKYGIDSITPSLLLGLTQSFRGDTSLFTFKKADTYLRSYVEQKRIPVNAAEKTSNELWLQHNAEMPGVVTLTSGLQYKVIRAGNGKGITESDVVSCNYTARLTNNTVFEATESGTPLRLYPHSVIKGFTEALLLMKEGDKWQVYIPASLGYGFDGIPGKVPPYATLIYDVEIVKVNGQ